MAAREEAENKLEQVLEDDDGTQTGGARNRSAIPAVIRISQSEGAASTSQRTRSDQSSTSGGLTAHTSAPIHAPRLWQPSRLRRSGSLTALEYDGSAHSLPQLPTPGKEEIYAASKGARNTKRTQSEERVSNTNNSGNEGTLPTSPSFSNVRQALHRIAVSEPFSISRNRDRSSSPSQGGGMHLFRVWPKARSSTREVPFRPANPFQPKYRLFGLKLFNSAQNEIESLEAGFRQKEEQAEVEFAALSVSSSLRHIVTQLFSLITLRIPSMYVSRMTRIFEEAEVTQPEMQRLIDGVARGLDLTRDWAPPNVSPALARFKISWEEFIDTLIQEWKTLNVVSALLLSAIMTMFQIDSANAQGVVRTASLVSLICATWSLIYGGIYIMRFRTMRSMYRASTWAEKAQRTKMNVFWNIWILLALPAVWLAWALIGFFTAILAFVWTTGGQEDVTPPGDGVERWLRVGLTIVFVLGAAYFVVVVQTFRSYGRGRKRVETVNLEGGASTGRSGQTVGIDLGGQNMGRAPAAGTAAGTEVKVGTSAGSAPPPSSILIPGLNNFPETGNVSKSGRDSPGIGGLEF